MAKRILVVDDEETLCEVLKFNLEADGYEADVAYSAEEALRLNLASYDLILLDVMMREISGTQLASIMKSNPSTAHVPVVFCTARSAEEDMVAGLDLGADDYITKPYSMKNVMARVRSVLRRTSSGKPSDPSDNDEEIISYGGLMVSPRKKLCMVDGEEVKMPKKEFEILAMLISHPGRVFTREELLREIWPDEVVVLDRVVDVNITRIRQKIGRYGRNIVTRSGYGYMFIDK